MKVLICGDTHLGRRNFKIKEREKDFEKAFTQIIDYAVKNKINAVIHAGDLFDTGRPSIDTIIYTVKELNKLKEKNIPFFIIAGSHDISVEGSFLKVLNQVGLVINLSDKKYYSAEEEGILLKGEEVNGLFVSGLYSKNAGINEVLELLKPEFPKKAFKIFVFHHIIEDINPLFSTVKKSCLPKGFDLYVSGHWHEYYETKFNNKLLLYPGSTESCDFREMKNDNKGFIIYDTNEEPYEFVKLHNRKSVIIEHDCNGLTPEEIVRNLKKDIKEGKGEMLFFVLKGRIKTGVKSEINKEEVYESAKKNNYLFCKIYTGLVENPEEKQTTIGKKSIKEIEEEFFKSKGLEKKEVLIAQKLIKDLGNDCTPSQLEKNIESIIEWLKEEAR